MAALLDVILEGQHLGKVVAVGEMGLDYDRYPNSIHKLSKQGYRIQGPVARCMFWRWKRVSLPATSAGLE